MCEYVCLNVNVCMYTCMWPHVFTCGYYVYHITYISKAYICLRAYMCVYVQVYTWVHLYAHLCIHVCTYAYVHVWMSELVSKWVPGFICLQVLVSIWKKYVCMHIHIYMCLHSYMWTVCLCEYCVCMYKMHTCSCDCTCSLLLYIGK